MATYRLQFHQGFGFLEARSILPYLKNLGITTLYSSPLFKARRGSLHGYSVTNPLELNPELGSKAGFDHLVHKLKVQGMELLLDVVPNHMAMSPSNPWWMDVLENGARSPYAVFFDIDWTPSKGTLHNRVLLPILGKPFGQTLENQELKLSLEEEGFRINFYDYHFPLDPKTYGDILTYRLAELEQQLGEGDPAILGLHGLITMVEHLPPRTAISAAKYRERQRTKQELQKRLWLLYQGSPAIREFLDANVRLFNGRRGDPASFEPLDTLLARQAYRLAFWQVTLDIINYRRFFSINELIGIRVEDPRVFEATHALLFKLVKDGKVNGVRVDHIDGLYDPQEYLLRLKERLTPKDKSAVDFPGFTIYVEKILSQTEPLPQDWPVCGTTGYDFLNMVNGVLVDEAGHEELASLYARLTGFTGTFTDLVYEKKKLTIETLFGGEMESLGHDLNMLAEQDRHGQDISYQALVKALKEVTACLPIYRTYIRDYEVSSRDRRYLEDTLEEAMQRNPDPGVAVYYFLRRVLLLQFLPSFTVEKQESWLRFVMRWQQYTGAIMAKGLEDTALYVYNCLTSLNEVGSESHPVPVFEFHHFNADRQANWPRALNATSTHDSKRSEDVRQRLNVLSEMPRQWEECLSRWRTFNQKHLLRIGAEPVPDPNEEMLIYQTMVGFWPLAEPDRANLKNRLEAYVIKAAREAKVYTRWIAPDCDHEDALLAFVDAILKPSPDNRFLKDFNQFQAQLAYFGALNSLSQVVLKIASPGIPDFYQGTEIWDFSLVDPDNRRPVNYQKRLALFKELKQKESRARKTLQSRLLQRWQDGAIKLFITSKALNFRRTHPELFLEGEYLPLHGQGKSARHLVAFARRRGENWVLAVTPRLCSQLTPAGTPPLGAAVWQNDSLSLPSGAPEKWENVFFPDTIRVSPGSSGPELPLAAIFRHLPVALLAGQAVEPSNPSSEYCIDSLPTIS
ncbi:MAG: malto-oligosyltrehalose synthase [Deltaproteobacteria bacterium]|jgi:(1->4)-alpha-D-glucan 1-alpha-D-glucosylmutase